MGNSGRIQPKTSGSSKYLPGEDALVQRLAKCSFHLPGNSWCEDWKQYIGNNHPLFGICYYSNLHPGNVCYRILTLMGSIALGLTIANILCLFFIYFQSTVPDAASPLMNVPIGVNTTIASHSMALNSMSITKFQVILWTIGSLLHCILDFSVRHFSASACCQFGVCSTSTLHWKTSNFVLGFIILVGAMGSLWLVVRALFLEGRANPQIIQSAGLLDNFMSPEDAPLRALSRFLMSWVVELLITWFATYFLFVTIIFSGVLGCCRVPILGGRPYEIYASELPR